MNARPLRVTALAASLLAGGLAGPACILDFDGLTGGDAAGGACAKAAVLDCSACPKTCPAGACAPVVVAAGEPAAVGPGALAASGGALYWVNEGAGTIARITGQGAPEIIATASAPRAIAAAGGRVVWSDKDGLWGCSADACALSAIHLASRLAPGTIDAIAFDGDVIAWTESGVDVDVGDGAVRRCLFDACSDAATIASAQLFPAGIALYGDSIVWAERGTANMNGSVRRAPSSGGAPQAIVAALDLPTGVAIDATHVYWTEANDMGAVRACPYNQGYCNTPVDVAPAAGPLGRPLAVALGGGRVYFSETLSGAIKSCPLGGCGQHAPTVHAAARPNVRAIALSPTCLLWTDDDGGGGVVKAAR